MSSNSAPKVLLTTLTQRTSAKGNAYLTGWLAKARVIGFRGDDDEHGNPTWNLYLSEPERRESSQAAAPDRPERSLPPAPASPELRRQQRASRASLDAQRRHEDAMINLNDQIPHWRKTAMKMLNRMVTRMEKENAEQRDAATWGKLTVIARHPGESYEAYNARYEAIRAAAPPQALLVVLGSFSTDDPPWPEQLDAAPANGGK